MNAARWLVAASGLLGFAALAGSAWARHAAGGTLAADALAALHTGFMLALIHAGLAGMLSLHLHHGHTLPPRRLIAVAALWWVGSVVFCAVIALRHLAGVVALAPLAPLGGMLMMAGWMLFSYHGLRMNQP